MELKQRYVVPKIQMIINGLLSQCENSQVDFSHEEYSIELRNRNFLCINWYEPELSDIEWTLQFMGIKSLKHISVSHHQRNRIRILFWRANSLHFLEGETKGKASTSNLKKCLEESEKIIELLLPSNDDVLYISEDIFPMEKKGVYFIETVNKLFFVLIATDKKHELIQLNQQNKISKLFSSVAGLWAPMIDENQVQKTVVSHTSAIIINECESFKTMSLRDFGLDIRFVNIPLNPGDKCKFQTYQLYSTNLKNIIFNQLQSTQNLVLTRSQIYKITNTEIIAIFLLKDSYHPAHYFMASVTVDYEKKSHTNIKIVEFKNNDLISIQFDKIHEIGEINYLAVKKQLLTGIIIEKVSMRDLQVAESYNLKSEGPSFLCSTQNQDHLLLLCPYKVIQIDSKPKQMIASNSESMMEEGKQNQRLSSFNEIISMIQTHQPKLSKDFHSGKQSSVQNSLSTLENHLNTRLSKQTSSGTEEELIQFLKVWTSISLYESIVKCESRSSRKFADEHRTFNDLNATKQNYKQIRSIFDHLIHQNRVQEFLLIWIQFLKSYKSKDYFKDQKIRKVESQLLNDQFSHYINKILEVLLKINKSIGTAIQFVENASGIIEISRQIYRQLLKRQSNDRNLKSLKQIALEKVNLDLILIIYFEAGQISKQEIRQCFKIIKEQSQELYENFAKQFVNEYLQRMKGNKVVNRQSRSLSNLLQIFSGQGELMRRIFEQSGTDLGILLNLREGKRREVAKKISEIAETMKMHKNKEVNLYLSLEAFIDNKWFEGY